MKKKVLSTYLETLPNFLEHVIDNIKDNFDEYGQEALDQTKGISGILIKLFGQRLLDSYFEKRSEAKLDEFGYGVYLESSLVQAENSLKDIEYSIGVGIDEKEIINVIKTTLEEERENYNKADIVLLFEPKKHPAVKIVRTTYEIILKNLGLDNEVVNKFLKDFNSNIGEEIKANFGDDYEEHLREIEENWLKKNETKFLLQVKELGRIGFSEDESFPYEETYGRWKKVEEFREKDKGLDEEQEGELKLVEDLIDEYFAEDRCEGEVNFLKHILFIVSDFGKGKSVFMKHYASKLATQYLQTGDGLFPVYFNLRNLLGIHLLKSWEL